MKHLLQYEAMDFVYDREFTSWVYDGKNDVFWTQWLTDNPQKQAAVAEARRILEAMKIVPATTGGTRVDDEISRLLNTIDRGKTTVFDSKPVRKAWWWAAASVLLAAAVGGLVLLLTGDRSGPVKTYYSVVTAAKHLVEQVNTSGQSMKLILPDGSEVELAHNSRISYAGSFRDSAMRDVFLSGEAFFRVTKNPVQPFRVFANEVVTKVLGTSFRVRAFDKDSTINVTVRTGRVNVYSQEAEAAKNTAAVMPHTGGILLTPNQEAIYRRYERRLEKKLLDKPVIIAPGIGLKEMVFEEAPLIKVLELLKKAYGINITYDAETLQKCTITADLRDESLSNKLNLICKAIDASYEIVDSVVFINAKGCQ